MENGMATLKKNMTVSYKTKHTFITQHSNFTLEHLSQINENVCSHTKKVRGSYNIQKLEMTQMLFKE